MKLVLSLGLVSLLGLVSAFSLEEVCRRTDEKDCSFLAKYKGVI
jgi:hypothetical protein